jgi:hypothetical protein
LKDVANARLKAFHDFSGVILRAIVDDDDFYIGFAALSNRFDAGRKKRSPIVRRNDHTDPHGQLAWDRKWQMKAKNSV